MDLPISSRSTIGFPFVALNCCLCDEMMHGYLLIWLLTLLISITFVTRYLCSVIVENKTLYETIQKMKVCYISFVYYIKRWITTRLESQTLSLLP